MSEKIPCPHCANRTDIHCDETHCDIAGPGEPFNANQCRTCYLRLGGDPAIHAKKIEAEEPGLFRKAWNFAQASLHHVRHGLPIVGEEVAKRRLAICEACTDYFDPGRRVCRRPECGCNMDAKVTWAEQRCPIGKWESVLPLAE